METTKQKPGKLALKRAVGASPLKRDFRFYLQDVLAERTSRNPNYSLRSFAKALQISPAALSALLNGKRPITQKMKERIGLALGLSIEELSTLKAKAHGNTKFKLNSELEINFQQVTIDTFAIISEPYHYAILELMKTRDFESNPKWIAQRLKLTISEVNIAIERLERVGLIIRDAADQWRDTTQGFSTDIREGLTTEGQRRFQEKSLQQAATALHSVPVELRDNTSMTLAIQSADLPKAKEMIKNFRRRFCADLEATPEPNEVYQLTISFVPLTVPKLNRGKS